MIDPDVWTAALLDAAANGDRETVADLEAVAGEVGAPEDAAHADDAPAG